MLSANEGTDKLIYSRL